MKLGAGREAAQEEREAETCCERVQQSRHADAAPVEAGSQRGAAARRCNAVRLYSYRCCCLNSCARLSAFTGEEAGIAAKALAEGPAASAPFGVSTDMHPFCD